MIRTFVGLGSSYRVLPCTQGGGDSMLYSLIWGCTVRPLQSEEGKCVAWAGCSEPLLVIPSALWGISAGAIMNTEIVDDEDEENSITSFCLMNLILYIVSQAMRVILSSLEANVDSGVLVC